MIVWDNYLDKFDVKEEGLRSFVERREGFDERVVLLNSKGEDCDVGLISLELSEGWRG